MVYSVIPFVKNLVIQHHLLDAVRAIFLFLLHFLICFAVHLYRARLHDSFLYSEESTLFDRNLHLYLVFHKRYFITFSNKDL